MLRKSKYLVALNFIHILNDSMFKMVSIFYLMLVCGQVYKTDILTLNSISFALPYILLSIPGGKLTDYFNVKKIILGSKIFEFVVFCAITTYAISRQGGRYAPMQDILTVSMALVFLGARTCVFVPARYFLVNHWFQGGEKLRNIASLIGVSTYGGMLVGIIGASVITDFFDKNYVYVFAISCFLSLVGILFVFMIGMPEVKVDEDKRVSLGNLVSFYMNKQWKIALAILANTIFMGISIFYQMNIINYAVDFLKIDETYSGYLYFCVGLGMSFGILIGLRLCSAFPNNYFQISGIGCIGLGMGVGMLYFLNSFVISIITMFISGTAMGIFIIPMEIYIQGVCPKAYIPMNTGLCNLLGFIAVATGAGAIYLGGLLKLSSRLLFMFSGVFMIFFGILIFLAGRSHVKKMRIK